MVLGKDDAVILAVPPYAAAALVPGLDVPTEFRAIVNAHFRIEPAPHQPPILGVLNATTEWVFAFPGRVAVTVSAADRLIDTPRDELAQTIWSEVAAATGLPATLPPWQIVRERRATFAATPEQDALRPGAEHAMEQPVPRRRLDKYRLARHDRKCHSIRAPRGRSRRATLNLPNVIAAD